MASLKKSFGWQTAQHLARGAAGMIIASLLARTVGERGLGVLDSTFALLNLIAGCAQFGIPRIVIRELCGEGKNINMVKGTSLVLLSCGSIIGIIIANALVCSASSEERITMACASILLVVQPFSYLVSSAFEAHGHLDRWAKALFIGLVISSIARISLALQNASLYWLALAYSADVAVSCAMAWIMAHLAIPSWWGGWKFDISVAKSLLRQSLPLFLTAIASYVYISMDTLMLKYLAGYEETGLYGAATRISQIPLFLPGILAGTFTSRLMASYNKDGCFDRENLSILMKLLVGLGFAVLIGGWLLGPFGVKLLYGDSFARSGDILRVHVVGVFFLIIGSIRNHLLILEGRGKLILLGDVSGAVSNLCLNFWLIPLYGAMGASWATAISYFIAFFLINAVHPELRKYNRILLSAFDRKIVHQNL